MTLVDFDFALPEDRIALRPARPRDSARLLLVDPDADAFADRGVRDLPGMLRAGDVLVFNNTRVIPAALEGVRPAREAGGADVPVSVNLHARCDASQWLAFARPGKRLREGDQIVFSPTLCARVEDKRDGGEVRLSFNFADAALDAAIAAVGVMPLPPYIAERRAIDAADADDYQTVYAQANGSVAAPTAGLHFTPWLLEALDAVGVERLFVTLHVGAGTFLPVKTEDIRAHTMHFEWCEITQQTAAALNAAKAEGRRIVAVGTTALRTLEGAVDTNGHIRPIAHQTDIFITPGFKFGVADGLWTNFHLPKSTLFMLVCAFAGTARMQAAYAHAIAQGYRFYSYGDASLLWRAHD